MGLEYSEEIMQRTREMSEKIKVDMMARLKQMAEDMEKVWGERVHMVVAIIPIDTKNERPAGIMIEDTLGGHPMIMQYLISGCELRIEDYVASQTRGSLQ